MKFCFAFLLVILGLPPAAASVTATRGGSSLATRSYPASTTTLLPVTVTVAAEAGYDITATLDGNFLPLGSTVVSSTGYHEIHETKVNQATNAITTTLAFQFIIKGGAIVRVRSGLIAFEERAAVDFHGAAFLFPAGDDALHEAVREMELSILGGKSSSAQFPCRNGPDQGTIGQAANGTGANRKAGLLLPVAGKNRAGGCNPRLAIPRLIGPPAAEKGARGREIGGIGGRSLVQPNATPGKIGLVRHDHNRIRAGPVKIDRSARFHPDFRPGTGADYRARAHGEGSARFDGEHSRDMNAATGWPIGGPSEVASRRCPGGDGFVLDRCGSAQTVEIGGKIPLAG